MTPYLFTGRNGVTAVVMGRNEVWAIAMLRWDSPWFVWESVVQK